MEKTSHENIKSSVDYYDAIADHYDTKMNVDLIRKIRLSVKDYFTNLGEAHRILDFGAGTGNDLEWQLKLGYHIVYFEPSVKMAAIANRKYQIEDHNQIETLIGQEATYTNLENYKNQKLDAIFSNFAALNSIKDLSDLFRVLAIILKKKGNMVCIVYGQKGTMNRLKSFLLPNLKTKIIHVSLDDSDESMTAYLHTKKQILSSAEENNFRLLNDVDLNSSGFRLYHFIKT